MTHSATFSEHEREVLNIVFRAEPVLYQVLRQHVEARITETALDLILERFKRLSLLTSERGQRDFLLRLTREGRNLRATLKRDVRQ